MSRCRSISYDFLPSWLTNHCKRLSQRAEQGERGKDGGKGGNAGKPGKLRYLTLSLLFWLISSLVNLYHVSLWLFCHFVCPFLLGPSWETPELKNELDFFSGTNRPLASSARGQDIRTYENSSADWSRESGFPSEVSKAICFGLVCFSGAPARAKRAWDRAPYS